MNISLTVTGFFPDKNRFLIRSGFDPVLNPVKKPIPKKPKSCYKIQFVKIRFRIIFAQNGIIFAQDRIIFAQNRIFEFFTHLY